jgi:hypothetical protein
MKRVSKQDRVVAKIKKKMLLLKAQSKKIMLKMKVLKIKRRVAINHTFSLISSLWINSKAIRKKK